ncbi:D-tyrosyl-tRNA(Tyr) deacylase [Candidatus Woesebacteria bacterium RBG_19FT_COMBO_47_8]|uniref:D-aminoacyl-tRNA deacylase n=1 Tax=Candidatus Woesebacteria bacterium RBG_13_46_13 TaxID=1802479 RepID=A0A1F7X5W4_9BACT|nr:MAG: D-tyrosyl-tRNA(Tyr) deacylase [Candidatus Woesebacteria bacterium RBG_13_46_13]OGM16719.1 MAG: D-tyrosyl-tRNA(Tyr) deacylase [Candidatus Woesebacteria bacterium RBG_19FT_COMBO_47_8]HJX59123.1 D-aminoacyl-tRNA deacylase [Patescibacteria group bacterium]
MRLVIQRVTKAVVKVGNKQAGKIDKGLLILVGVGKEDTRAQAEALAEKLSKLRVMADGKGKMNLSVSEAKGEFLVVSQFTLYADTSGGNRPSFIKAAEPALAKEIYEHFLAKLKENGVNVATGSFGDYMNISAELDGPVTIILES